ncbi:hypothetical protein PG987_005876 [Apiospora arundinis]
MCQSSDMKDKVYGILGLVERDFMKIDYKLPVEEIIRRFTEATIQRDGNLHILQASGFQKQLLSLPSWVPDLSTSTPLGTLPARDRFPFRPDGALVVRGKSIDTISAIGPVLPSGIAYAPWAANTELSVGSCSFAHVFHKWESLAASLIPGWGRFLPSSVINAFAVTLVADNGYLGKRGRDLDECYSSDAQAFASWYSLCGTGVLEAADPTGYLSDYMIYDRCFFVTEGGSMGLTTPGARVGDRIAYIPGAYQPFVLRPLDMQGEWTMHGDCYLYGLDIYELFEDDQHVVEEFVIR